MRGGERVRRKSKETKRKGNGKESNRKGKRRRLKVKEGKGMKEGKNNDGRNLTMRNPCENMNTRAAGGTENHKNNIISNTYSFQKKLIFN